MPDQHKLAKHWVGGRIVDSPRRVISPWRWLLAVLALVWTVDLILQAALGPNPAVALDPGEPSSTGEIRAQLRELSEAAAGGTRAILLLGDSVLAGDVLANAIAECEREGGPRDQSAEQAGCQSLRGVDWRRARVLEQMQAELSPDADVKIAQVALDGLLPIDAVHVLAELDRLDPAGRVEVVYELNLRYFSMQYANQRACTRDSLCELGGVEFGRPRFHRWALAGFRYAGGRAHDWLEARVPVRRHLGALRGPPDDLISALGLAVERADAHDLGDDAHRGRAAVERRRAQALARVAEHYRESSIGGGHAQYRSLLELLERLRARGRRGTLFSTPLEDAFADAVVSSKKVSRRNEKLAREVNDIALRSPQAPIALTDLDHPLFGAGMFLDHVHLRPEGNRLLALNLLHELDLPLAQRPFEWMLVHDEDVDRSLVHRRGYGFADGGAWEALLAKPQGVTASADGRRIVIADTDNHVLRQLRGNMQILERLAGKPLAVGDADGHSLRGARLDHPRSPVLHADAVYFLDGEKSSRLRVLVGEQVRTIGWLGPICPSYDQVEIDEIDGRLWAYLLCHDDRIVGVDLARSRSRLILDPRAPVLADPDSGAERRYTCIEAIDEGRLLFADGAAKIWTLTVDAKGRSEPPELLYANEGAELLPNGRDHEYPFGFDEMHFANIAAMQWVERYEMLLIQDEHPVGPGANTRLLTEQTERIHLRLLDFETEQIFPWVKAVPHSEAFHMRNARVENFVSYFHIGSMAIVQDDASLVWVEHDRSRVFRLADGLLAVQKSGNLHTRFGAVEIRNPVGEKVSTQVGKWLRPDRYMSTRHDPLARRGPYVVAMFNSSLSAMSDRIGNYSVGRLLELELQAELGTRDLLRIDLFQRSESAMSLSRSVERVAELLDGQGPPPDVILVELHDGPGQFLAGLGNEAERRAQLEQLIELAARYDSLLLLYDNSAMDAHKRDGLRPPSTALSELIAEAKQLGIVVLEPSDWLLRELLRDSPWGNQPWKPGERHGATWAVQHTAQVLGALSAPLIREHLRDREPARLREGLAEVEGD